jgi:glycosyltransferase involved in cell wall biosynthesis
VSGHTVTAIVPTHNRTSLLEMTLRTILWQQDVDLEVIVVDDGSSEDVQNVITRLGDSRLRLIRHDVSQGVASARNRAAAAATGTWLAFCDDDDLWAPEKLALQLAAARAADRAWAYGGAVLVNLGLGVLSARLPPSPEELVNTLPRGNTMPGGASNVVVRAETLMAAGGWDSSLINLADWDLWARLARHGPPACVDRPLVGYRIHPGNASADTSLILREARLMDGRYGARLDYGALHHYLAWVHLRSGRRRPAVSHLVHAAVRGQGLEVARTLSTLARARIGKAVTALRPRPSCLHRAWIAEAETWISRLRDPGLER